MAYVGECVRIAIRRVLAVACVRRLSERIYKTTSTHTHTRTRGNKFVFVLMLLLLLVLWLLSFWPPPPSGRRKKLSRNHNDNRFVPRVCSLSSPGNARKTTRAVLCYVCPINYWMYTQVVWSRGILFNHDDTINYEPRLYIKHTFICACVCVWLDRASDGETVYIFFRF